ncbi:MAG: hypothetical protein AB7F59_13195 [Bdellovibrionales bacterium]
MKNFIAALVLSLVSFVANAETIIYSFSERGINNIVGSVAVSKSGNKITLQNINLEKYVAFGQGIFPANKAITFDTSNVVLAVNSGNDISITLEARGPNPQTVQIVIDTQSKNVFVINQENGQVFKSQASAGPAKSVTPTSAITINDAKTMIYNEYLRTGNQPQIMPLESERQIASMFKEESARPYRAARALLNIKSIVETIRR